MNDDEFRDKVVNDPLWAADEIVRLTAEVTRLRDRLAELQPLDFRPDEERYERRTLT